MGRGRVGRRSREGAIVLKFLFAPDSFKGSLSATEMARMMDRVCRIHFPEAETVLAPMADGGEGTVEALVTARSGRMEEAPVTGPDGATVRARFGLIDAGTAVLEMAQASGLPLMAGRPDPLGATSRGTGELIRHALDLGARRLLLGIGGSATNDGGMGMLSALGAKFYDGDGTLLEGRGRDLALVERADLSSLDPRLRKARITVICDVTNPLCGPDGATAVYGPQKGVIPALFPVLEDGMARYARLLEEHLGRDVSRFPGAGAAGGMGAALGGVMQAEMRKGIDAVLEAVRFDQLLPGCDLVLTGEGRMDAQSILYGKAPAGIARRCKAANVPVIAIVGGMGPGAEGYYREGMTSIMTTVSGVMPLEEAMGNAERLFLDALERTFRMIKIGMTLGSPAC